MAMLAPGAPAKIVEAARRVLAGDHGELTPEIRAAAAVVMEKHGKAEALAKVMGQVQAFMKRMQELPERSRWQHVQSLVTEADEIMDQMLDLPEPKRTETMLHMTILRQKLMEIRDRQ